MHGHYVPSDWCVLGQRPGLQKGAEIMRTCSVSAGVGMPERLLAGVIDSGEALNMRVGVLEGVPDLLGTRVRGSISGKVRSSGRGSRGGPLYETRQRISGNKILI